MERASSGKHHSIWMQIHTDYSRCPSNDDDGDGDDGEGSSMIMSVRERVSERTDAGGSGPG